MNKQTRRLKTGLPFLLLLVTMAMLLLSTMSVALAADDVPPPIDPQTWQLQRDRSWKDFVPNPVIDWKKEFNPNGYYNIRNSSNRVSKIRGALCLFEYLDRPFITSQPLGSDVLGYYLFNNDGSGYDYEKGIVHNPVLNCARTLKESEYSTNPNDPNFQKDPVFANWWRDYLIGEHEGNHGVSQEEFYLENTYGKYHLQFDAYGPFEVNAFEFELRDSYQGTTELPPSFRSPSGMTSSSSIDNWAFAIMSAKLNSAPNANYFRNNYDFFHILHAGYDESGVWQEFGMGLVASRADLPDELTPIGRMHKVEEVFTARPELLDTYITRYRNTSNAQIFRDAKALYEESLINPEVKYVFKLSDADWEWARNWKYQTARNTRYVAWTSWEAGTGEWSHMNSTSTFGTSMNFSTQGECDGMATFAHEFGHISGIGDNYGNPYTARLTAATEPWELMSRGSFAGPYGDHARWTAPGIEGGSVPVHFMQTNKQSSSCYDTGDVLTITNQQLAARTPLVAEIVARNIPLNNNKTTARPEGLYPWLEADYGLVSPNYYKAIRMTFGSSTWADQAGASGNVKSTGFTWNNTTASRMAVEVVQRTGYDSFVPDSGVIISRDNRVVDSHNYDIALIDYMIPDGITLGGKVVDDYVSYTVGHAQQLYDTAFKAGKSVTDTGYYKSSYDPAGSHYSEEVPRYYTSESSGVTWQKEMLKPGSIVQWEPQNGREIASGETVNEFYDRFNKLHFYILAKNTHEGKYGEFISYTIGMLHDNGVAAAGKLKVVPEVIEPEKWNRVAIVNFNITNEGATATDIIRVNPVCEMKAVVLNDLYAIDPGETVTVPVYITLSDKFKGVEEADLAVSLEVTSESNKANAAAAAAAAHEFVISITSLRINAPASMAVKRGETINPSVVLNEYGFDEGIIWSVNNPLYATVNADKSVTILNRTGTAVLTATDPLTGLCFSIILRIS